MIDFASKLRDDGSGIEGENHGVARDSDLDVDEVMFGSESDEDYLNQIHPLDRPGQQEALKFCIDSDKKIIVIDADTGFGKSAIAAHLSAISDVLALNREKALQDENYKGSYGFDVLKGKGNYPCGYDDDFTADVCGIGVTVKPGCEFMEDEEIRASHCNQYVCPYKRDKARLKSSSRGSLNYTKFFMEPDEVWNQPDYLVCDEAHQLPELIIEFSSFSVRWDNEFIKKVTPIPFKSYLGARPVLKMIESNLKSLEPKKEIDPKSYTRWRHTTHRFSNCMSVLEKAHEEGELSNWHVVSDLSEGTIVIKPLTAKYNFKRMVYNRGKQIVFTTATIGPWLFDALGIREDEIDYYSAPELYPPELRPIYYLSNSPKMTKDNTGFKCENTKAIQTQAHIIKKIANRYPDKSHVSLVNSTSHAWGLLKALNKLGGVDVFMSTESGTERKMQEWNRMRKPGRILITFSLWEGADLGLDFSIIICKIPFPPIGKEGSFERAKFNYSETLWRTSAIVKLVQGLGRVHRGKPEHYGLDEAGRPRKLAFILDANLARVKSGIPDVKLNAIVEVRETSRGFSTKVDGSIDE